MPFNRSLFAEELARRRAMAAQGQGAAPPGIDALQQKAGNRAVNQVLAEQAPEDRREAETSANSKYLALQSQIDDEKHTYTMLSNVMKTRHDTVKDSISNIR